MPSIYENIMETDRLLDACFDLETGEVDEAKEEELKALREKLIAEGLEKLCNLRAEKMAFLEALRTEEDRLAAKETAEEEKIRRLEDYILLIHRQSGKDKSTAGTWTVGTRKSTRVVIKSPEIIDPRFVETRQERIVNKSKIKEALKSGATVAGAELETRENLVVK